MTSPKKNPFPKWQVLAEELKRRRVYPVVAAYAVGAFILLQIAEITFGPLRLPDWMMIGLIVLVIIGFPVVTVLAWVYDLTPTGIRKDVGQFSGRVRADRKPSIAVLPFADMSPERDQIFFCEGVAEAILNALTKIEQLDVAARTSSFVYGAGSGDVRKIGRQLGVRAVLEGSVRKSGDRIRVTAQLVSTADGYHIWSKTFDEQLSDIFAIQDEIATGIADALLETISAGEPTSIRTTSTTSIDAYEYYLRGRQFFNRFRKKDIEFALQMFRHAIDTDAGFAPAWAGYADCHSFLVMYADPKPDHRERAQEASARAVELDPDLAEAHASRGLAHLASEEFDAAEQEFQTAIELNPRLFEAYYYFARTCFHQGRLDEAIELFRKASKVNPADYQSRCLRIQILRGMGRLDEARSEAKRAIKVVERHLKWNPDDARAFHLGAGTLVVLGDAERAKRWLHRAIGIDSDDPVVLYNLACNLATLGETEEAFRYLGRAAEVGAISAAWMRNDEDLANLRADPRFAQVLQKLAEVR